MSFKISLNSNESSSKISFLFKANLPQRNPSELKSQSIRNREIGRASRGEEEKLRPNLNSNNKQVLSRRQRREQDRKMRRS